MIIWIIIFLFLGVTFGLLFDAIGVPKELNTILGLLLSSVLCASAYNYTKRGEYKLIRIFIILRNFCIFGAVMGVAFGWIGVICPTEDKMPILEKIAWLFFGILFCFIVGLIAQLFAYVLNRVSKQKEDISFKRFEPF